MARKTIDFASYVDAVDQDSRHLTHAQQTIERNAVARLLEQYEEADRQRLDARRAEAPRRKARGP